MGSMCSTVQPVVHHHHHHQGGQDTVGEMMQQQRDVHTNPMEVFHAADQHSLRNRKKTISGPKNAISARDSGIPNAPPPRPSMLGAGAKAAIEAA